MNEDAGRITVLVSKNVLTLVRNENASVFKLSREKKGNFYMLVLVPSQENTIARKLKTDYKADFVPVGSGTVISPATIDGWIKKYSAILIGVHSYSFSPVNNFGLSASQVELLERHAGSG